MLDNIILVIILIAIASGIIWYLIRAKKKGQTCIGCPHSKQCSKSCCGGCNGCGSKKSDVK